jgi:hypothetical protein
MAPQADASLLQRLPHDDRLRRMIDQLTECLRSWQSTGVSQGKRGGGVGGFEKIKKNPPNRTRVSPCLAKRTTTPPTGTGFNTCNAGPVGRLPHGPVPGRR